MKEETMSMIAGLLQDRTQIALERLNEAILKESQTTDLARPLENYRRALRAEEDFDCFRKENSRGA